VEKPLDRVSYRVYNGSRKTRQRDKSRKIIKESKSPLKISPLKI